MYKKLVCFDFDATLIETPTPEVGIPKWEEATGLRWGGRGWWSNPESLNIKIFNPPVNDWVYKHYLLERSNPNAYIFLATGRLLKLQKQVTDILKYHNITPDDVFCNTGGDTFKFKCLLFEKIIRDNPGATEFTMYDDRDAHLGEFKKWAMKQPIKVNIIDVVNKYKIL